VRILFVNEKCGYFGGVEQNVAATARGLRSRGHTCFLAYGKSTERNLDSYKSSFEDVFLCAEICLPGEKSSGKSFQEIVRLVYPDVIYLHKVSRTDYCTPFVNSIRTVRMVHDHDLCCPRRHKYFFHNGLVCRSKAGWRCYLDLAFLEKSASGSVGAWTTVSIKRKLEEMRRNQSLDLLLVGSRFMRDELLQNGFSETKVQILPPMVPLKPEKVSPVPDEPVILCVAQLVRGKGVDLLLQALKRVSCDFRGIIVGAGNAESDLKALCHDLGLNDRVHFLGWVDNDAIGGYYARARVVVVPSRWPEPFGMIGLEAMHHGRPVVAFEVGGIPDWLEHEITGLIVQEQDVAGFSQALERLLLDRQLAQKLGQRAIIRAQERFSFEHYLEQTLVYLTG
jgi:glycosyltransferase involved in cell wall biosynthesis